MSNDVKECFCGGDAKYWDYNCGEGFYRECPHCEGTGVKRCACVAASVWCGLRLGPEVFEELPAGPTTEMSWDEYWGID